MNTFYGGTSESLNVQIERIVENEAWKKKKIKLNSWAHFFIFIIFVKLILSFTLSQSMILTFLLFFLLTTSQNGTCWQCLEDKTVFNSQFLKTLEKVLQPLVTYSHLWDNILNQIWNLEFFIFFQLEIENVLSFARIKKLSFLKFKF